MKKLVLIACALAFGSFAFAQDPTAGAPADAPKADDAKPKKNKKKHHEHKMDKKKKDDAGGAGAAGGDQKM